MPSTKQALTRREWVQRMVAGAGAGLAAPALAEAGWNETTVPTPLTAESAVNWKPAFFDEAQNQTLLYLTERILPGSGCAQVNRFLDLAMGGSTQENQRKFVDAMNAIEGEALRQFTKSFKDLAPEQQDAVLQAASTGKTSEPTHSTSTPSHTAAQPQPPSLRDHFDHLKGWVSSSYYSTEIGMKELGWKDEHFFDSLPGCAHPNGHS